MSANQPPQDKEKQDAAKSALDARFAELVSVSTPADTGETDEQKSHKRALRLSILKTRRAEWAAQLDGLIIDMRVAVALADETAQDNVKQNARRCLIALDVIAQELAAIEVVETAPDETAPA